MEIPSKGKAEQKSLSHKGAKDKKGNREQCARQVRDFSRWQQLQFIFKQLVCDTSQLYNYDGPAHKGSFFFVSLCKTKAHKFLDLVVVKEKESKTEEQKCEICVFP